VTGVPSDHFHPFKVTDTVLSPLEYTGLLPMDINGLTSAVTPLMVQNTGRHIIHSNVKTLETEFVADVGIGRIQFGPLPGASAEVNVAAWPEGVPAAGISPIPPGTLVAPGVTEAELLLLQAARAVTLATARASAPMYLFFAKIVIAPPSLRC
jgi:hypothetical protein